MAARRRPSAAIKRLRQAARLILLLLTILTVIGGRFQVFASQLPPVRHYAVDHFGAYFGIGTSTVTALAQDGQGFLWIGTLNGLFRYDGNNVKLFAREQGLPSNRVDQLLVAPGGELWVRTRKGIATFTHQHLVAIPFMTEIELRDVPQSFCLDTNGDLYAVSAKGLLRIEKWDGKVAHSTVVTPEPVDAVTRGPDDSIWYASGQRIKRLVPGSRQTEQVTVLRFVRDPVKALLINSREEAWIRTQNHLGLLDVKHRLLWQEQSIPGANMYGQPALDQDGNLLLPTSQGLYRRSGDDWEIITRNSGLTSSAVFAALEDREGNSWVGLAGAGLDRLPGSRQWWGWTDTEGLPDSLVLGTLRDTKSRLWVGTNNGLAMWAPTAKHWQIWSQKDGLPGSGIRQLALGKYGGLWVLCFQKGLVRFDVSGDSLKPVVVPLKVGDWQASSMSVAPDGSVWTDGEKNLYQIRFVNGQFLIRSIPVPEHIQRTTNLVAFSPRGVLWTAGENGVSRLEKGTWKRFGVQDGLLSNGVGRLSAISDNEVWIGYGDEDSATRAVAGADGKLSVSHFKDAVCVLGTDRKKNVWLEMQKGVGVLPPGGKLQTFTEDDGLLWNDVNCNAFWQENNGSILIGTSHGLARYNPERERPTPAPPQVVLTSVRFGDREKVEEHFPTIEYSNRAFVAQFASLFFRSHDHLTCRYRLRDLETEWTDTTLRELRYTSLPPGGYTLEVNCGSPESGWAQKPISYSFFIAPPWWRTWWAETAALGCFLGCIWLFVGYHTQSQRREKLRLEAAVEARSAELAKVNRELKEASLRDPLTGVYNRRFFYTTIPADASQAVRAYSARSNNYSQDHRDLIFFLLDIDHFKKVNDTYGHDAGDQLLIEVARRLNKVVRQSDFLIRWGGEEFMIVCRAAQREEAHLAAKRILESISGEPFQVSAGKAIPLTVSIGWAPFPWSQTEPASATVSDVTKFADQALYQAKEMGRNRAVGSRPSNMKPAVVTLARQESEVQLQPRA